MSTTVVTVFSKGVALLADDMAAILKLHSKMERGMQTEEDKDGEGEQPKAECPSPKQQVMTRKTMNNMRDSPLG